MFTKKERKNESEKEIMSWDTMRVDPYNKMVWSGKVRTVLYLLVLFHIFNIHKLKLHHYSVYL